MESGYPKYFLGENSRRYFNRFLRVPAVIWVVVAELIFFAIFGPDFASPANLVSIAVQASPLIVLSIGAAIVLISNGLDLSSGMVFTLSMSVAAILLNANLFWPIALLVGIGIGTVMGLLNGLLVTKGNLPSFLATLGTMGIAWGIGLGITELSSVAIPPGPTYFIGEGDILFIPMPIIITALVFVASHVIVYKTPFGCYLYSIGSNETAAALSGVNITKWKNLIYMFAGTLAGITGLMLLGRMHASHPNVGFGWEFDAVAAAVIGGVSIGGGRGKLFPVIFGALFIAILRNGMNFMGVSIYWQAFIKGFVIVGAIVLDLVMDKERRAID